ncbi:MAG: ABC transporter permease subunit [Streptosporangiaceae bacterium]|jgi:NitT/TauT family transport system permease protein
MAIETQPSAIEGLDNLELGGVPQEPRARRIARSAWAATWPKLLAIAIVLALWQLVVATGWKSDVLKGPTVVLPTLWGLMHHQLLWQAVGITLRRAVLGYGLAIVIGSIVGALVARIPLLRAGVGSIITGLQVMPSIVWFPFAIIIFGLTTPAILFVMVLGAAPSIANGLITGVDYTPPLLLKAGRTMGLRGYNLYRYLILPASLPAYVAGMKQGWAFAFRGLMAGELLVLIIGQPSIGVLENNYQDLDFFAGATSILIVILIIGIAVDTLFTSADRAVRRRRGLLEPGRAA